MNKDGSGRGGDGRLGGWGGGGGRKEVGEGGDDGGMDESVGVGMGAAPQQEEDSRQNHLEPFDPALACVLRQNS